MKLAEGFAARHPSDVYAADLAWLDRLVEREILKLRARYELSLDELRGLYISDRQVDELLCERLPEDCSPDGPARALSVEALMLRGLRRDDTRLAELARRFALTGCETDLLLLALAPELALRYETFYAYLNNDVTRRHLTADLALRLLVDSGSAAELADVSAGARLFEIGLLDRIDCGEYRSLLAQGIALAPPAAHFLLGLLPEDPRLPAGIRVAADSVPVAGLLSPSARAAVELFSDRYPPQPGLIVCSAEATTEALAAARLHAARHGRALVRVPCSELSDEAAWPLTRLRIRLLALLADAIVVLFHEHDGFPQDPAPLLQLRRRLHDLAASGVPLLWAVPSAAPWPALAVDLPFVELALPAASSDDRANSWRGALTRAGLDAGAVPVDRLAEHFALPCSRIAVAAEAALRETAPLDTSSPDRLGAALWQAARRHSGQSLGQFASRVVKPHTWQQLVLPETTLRQVRDVAAAIGQRERVFRRWRMAERTGRGNGLLALFTGASGTGKTMSAAVIANDLGLDLYRIDLASVVSKYIGETEKNLDRIFQAAHRSNAILFFDEADALLGKRSEVKDAHDRYANIEVAYLLQKMEEHDGAVILASNLAKNLDQAFARRMHYVVEFPRPDAQLRARLWRGMFPPQAPLADDLDFDFLAGQFETSGGEIQAIALDAAFLASAEDSAIGMAQVVKAMARHQLKQGNPGGSSGYRQYHALARQG